MGVARPRTRRTRIQDWVEPPGAAVRDTTRLPGIGARDRVGRARARTAVRASELAVRGSLRYALILLPVCLCILTLYGYTSVAKMGYEVSQMESELKMLEQENGKLRLEVAQLQSMTRVETVARREMGLGNPTETKLVKVDDTAGELYAMLQSGVGSRDTWGTQGDRLARGTESRPRDVDSAALGGLGGSQVVRTSLLSRLLSASRAEAHSSR